jgi:GNAT superfamily N-acetyltransferase
LTVAALGGRPLEALLSVHLHPSLSTAVARRVVLGYATGVRAAGPDEMVIPTAGGCMRPWVWPGGTIHVRRCRVDDLAPGDIAVWFDGRRLLSHRVQAVRDGRFVTKGDSSRGLDPPADGRQLLGRVTRFSVLGVSWRLDGAAGRLIGRAVVAAPWLVPAVLAVYGPARRGLGRAIERAWTAAPARRWRRRLARPPEVQREGGGWPLRLRARRGRLEVGRVEVGRDGALRELWVRNLWRGLGIGRALAAAAVAAGAAAGLARLTAAVAPGDVRARALLAGAGFVAAPGGALVRELPQSPRQ